LKCYTLCGYAEIDGDRFYNSAILVDREGKCILNHRKKHLFESDKVWASEGS
jgi:predicted amidohydrolase